MEDKEKEEELFEGFDEEVSTLNDDDFEEEKTDDNETKEEEAKEETKETEDITVDEVESEEEKLKKKNAHFAELRRQKEAQEKQDREKQIKDATKLETELSILKKNPYTDEAINDEEDLKIYKIQKEIEENGGDPINDLPRKLAALNREASAKLKAQEEQKNKEQEEMAKDIQAFIKDHPEVDLDDLSKDKEYLDYAEGKIGRWTTTEIYESYMSSKNATNKQVKEAQTKVDNAIDEVAKQITKVPSASSNGGKTSKGFLDMTDDEYLLYEKENTGDFF